MERNGTSQADRRPSLKVVIPVMLFCIYYPYSWLILSSGAWTAYRWSWICSWPSLPAIIASVALFRYLPEPWDFLGTLVIAIILVAGLIYLASRRSWLLPLIAIITFLVSALNSMLAYHLYRN